MFVSATNVTIRRGLRKRRTDRTVNDDIKLDDNNDDNQNRDNRNIIQSDYDDVSQEITMATARRHHNENDISEQRSESVAAAVDNKEDDRKERSEPAAVDNKEEFDEDDILQNFLEDEDYSGFNYVVWKDYKIGGRQRQLFHETHPWSKLTVQITGKEAVERDKAYRWKCTFDPDNCEKTFVQQSVLWIHIKDLHILDEKTYQCEHEECDGRFNSKPALMKHIKGTHMTEAFACTTCGTKHQNHTAAYRCCTRRHRDDV